MISAKVICDSVSEKGIRLTTLQLRYPRMIHADFMTHRKFSRNGRSSRAVPFATLVKEGPYIPEFAKNQKGMVAGEKLTGFQLFKARFFWNLAVTGCKLSAKMLAKAGVHKQWVNRMLEWFGYIDVLVTSTDWSNFFELRDEEGAQPEIQELAKAMKIALEGSEPKLLKAGEWHLPYITEEDKVSLDLETLKKVSVARCARLTIKPFDGNASIEAELKRYNILMVSRPVHASPAEMIATPDTGVVLERDTKKQMFWDHPEEHGNYFGWRQFRKQIPFNTIWDEHYNV